MERKKTTKQEERNRIEFQAENKGFERDSVGFTRLEG